MQPQLPITFPFAEFLISPQTSWKRFVNPQFFFTYNLGDAAIENHVLRRAGSYGKQLGKILDVLDVLVRHLPAEALTASERRTVEELVELRVMRLSGPSASSAKRKAARARASTLTGSWPTWIVFVKPIPMHTPQPSGASARVSAMAPPCDTATGMQVGASASRTSHRSPRHSAGNTLLINTLVAIHRASREISDVRAGIPAPVTPVDDEPIG